MGEIDLCAQELFRTKFNSKQLLLEVFFDMMRISGSDESQSESNFPFLYIVTVLRRLKMNIRNVTENFHSPGETLSAYIFQRRNRNSN